MNMRKTRKSQVFFLICSLIICSFFSSFQFTLLWKIENFSALESPLPNNIPTGNHVSAFSRAPPRQWAYAFLMAACDPKFSEKYIGILYNVLVAAHNLRGGNNNNHNITKADIILLVQLSNEASATSLPKEQERLLLDMNVRIHYLQKPKRSSVVNFYTIQFEKFRILQLTEYSRVLIMDGDVMPLCNMDYLFELSEPEMGVSPPTLKENIILAWRNAPSHGGFFMLKPEIGAYEKIEKIIRKREQQALTMPYPHFDPKLGWGHVIASNPHDHVRFFREKNNQVQEWDWYGVFAEQGLLYYWTKYVQRHVSIVIGDEVENWGPVAADGDPNGIRLERMMKKNYLSKYACLPGGKEQPGSYGFLDNGFDREAPYVDFAHFTGQSKPWENPSKNSFKGPFTIEAVDDAAGLWFFVLRKLNQELRMNVDMENFTTQGPPVGRFYTHKKMAAAVRANAEV